MIVRTTLIFSTTDALLSRVIRAMSGSEVSHCGFGLTLDGSSFVVDSAILGCEMTTRDRWARGKRLVCEYEVPADAAPMLGTVLGYLGQGYDYSGMLGYLPIWVARWLGRKLKNPWGSPTKAVCSEFIIRAMQHNRAVPAWTALDPEAVYPEDLVKLCRLLGYAALPAL